MRPNAPLCGDISDCLIPRSLLDHNMAQCMYLMPRLSPHSPRVRGEGAVTLTGAFSMLRHYWGMLRSLNLFCVVFLFFLLLLLLLKFLICFALFRFNLLCFLILVLFYFWPSEIKKKKRHRTNVPHHKPNKYGL